MPRSEHQSLHGGQRQTLAHLQGLGRRGRHPDQGSLGPERDVRGHVMHGQDLGHLRLHHGRMHGNHVRSF